MEWTLIHFHFHVNQKSTFLKNYENTRSYLFVLSEKHIILFKSTLYYIKEKERQSYYRYIANTELHSWFANVYL